MAPPSMTDGAEWNDTAPGSEPDTERHCGSSSKRRCLWGFYVGCWHSSSIRCCSELAGVGCAAALEFRGRRGQKGGIVSSYKNYYFSPNRPVPNIGPAVQQQPHPQNLPVLFSIAQSPELTSLFSGRCSATLFPQNRPVQSQYVTEPLSSQYSLSNRSLI